MNSKTGDILDEQRWQAVTARSLSGCDPFLYAVVTTGIYCRPGCASRTPRRENVRFYSSVTAAIAAGFRPCKRCEPGQTPQVHPHAAAIRLCCEAIARRDEVPVVEEFASLAGWGPSRFRRVFKQLTGVTLKQYADAIRRQRLHHHLSDSNSVTHAIYNAGFNSSSRVYGKVNQLLGMAPSIFRDGGAQTDIRYAIGPCYLGRVLVAVTHRGVCAIELGDDDKELEDMLMHRFAAAQVASDATLADTLERVIAFLERPAAGLALSLDIQGTAFQQRVWEALQTIPAGETRSYRGVAELIGSPSSARAVANACARNTMAVAVPCHRVVGSDGRLAGYRWGVERKKALLMRERKDK